MVTSFMSSFFKLGSPVNNESGGGVGGVGWVSHNGDQYLSLLVRRALPCHIMIVKETVCCRVFCNLTGELSAESVFTVLSRTRRGKAQLGKRVVGVWLRLSQPSLVYLHNALDHVTTPAPRNRTQSKLV